MRYIFTTLLLLVISCASAISSETPHLKAYIISSEVSLSKSDVDDIYLKYGSAQNVYIVHITFSRSGLDKFNQLIKNKKKRELTLIYNKDILVGPIPIMMDKIENPFSVVIKKKDAAISVIEGLSK